MAVPTLKVVDKVITAAADGRTVNARRLIRFMCFPVMKNPTLQAVQIKTGISDGISTEAVSGLNEGDKVVTGTLNPTGTAAATSNPFGGGGFPRGR